MWSPEARAAALATRQANAQGKQQQQPARRKPGPQTAAHPNPGQRVAFGLRNKMIHDAGAPARMAAAAHQQGISALGHFGMNVGRALLGAAAGAAGTFIHTALRNQGGRRH
jgi:hypothetical protein